MHLSRLSCHCLVAKERMEYVGVVVYIVRKEAAVLVLVLAAVVVVNVSIVIDECYK